MLVYPLGLSLGSSIHSCPSTYCAPMHLSHYSPKICQDDRGTYILEPHGTNVHHISFLRFNVTSNRVGLVNGMYVEHRSIGLKGLCRIPVNLKEIMAIGVILVASSHLRFQYHQFPLDKVIWCPHTILHPIEQVKNEMYIIWRFFGYLASPWASLSLCGTAT